MDYDFSSLVVAAMGATFVLGSVVVWITPSLRGIFQHHVLVDGPRASFFVGNTSDLDCDMQFHRKYLSWTREYGDVMQFTTLGGTIHFLIASPEVVGEIGRQPTVFPDMSLEDTSGVSLSLLRHLMTPPTQPIFIKSMDTDKSHDIVISTTVVNVVMSEFCEIASEKLAILSRQWSAQLASRGADEGCLIPAMYYDMVALGIDILGKFGLMDEFDALRDEKREMVNGVRVLNEDSLEKDQKSSWIWNFPHGRVSEDFMESVAVHRLVASMMDVRAKLAREQEIKLGLVIEEAKGGSSSSSTPKSSSQSQSQSQSSSSSSSSSSRAADGQQSQPQRRRRGKGELLSELFGRLRELAVLRLFDLDHDYIGELMDRDAIMEESINLLAGGFETIPNLLSWTLFQLARHPDAQRKLVAELREGTRPSSLKMIDICSMTYAQCVVLESLRTFPTAPLSCRVADSPTTLDGGKYRIPAGARCHLFNLGMNMNPRTWSGSGDPKAFRPERFAEAPDARVYSRFHTFFACPEGSVSAFGKVLAATQLLLCTSTLVRRFRFESEFSESEAWEYEQRAGAKRGLKLRVFSRR